MPKTKKTDAQRFSAFSFRYPTHVACILLAAPTGARADDASSLVHWETWGSSSALLPAALWVSSSYTHCPCPSLLLVPTLWPHHALRHFRRAAHSPRSTALRHFLHIGLPNWKSRPCCGANVIHEVELAFFVAPLVRNVSQGALCITIVCQHHVTGADTTKRAIVEAASAVSTSKQGPSPVHDHLDVVRPEVRVRVRVRYTVCVSFPTCPFRGPPGFWVGIDFVRFGQGKLTPDSLLYNSISHCVLAEDPHRSNPLII